MEKTLQRRLVIDKNLIAQLPDSIKNEIIASSPSKQVLFSKLYLEESHSLLLTYLFLLPVVFSFHYGALNNWTKQFLFWITGGGLLMWWLLDLVRLPAIVKEKNDMIAFHIWDEVGSIGEGPAEGLF